MHELSEVPVYLWFILIPILLIQGLWIFQDASKRGEHKWLWGIFGLLNVPSNLLIYLIVTRVILKPNPCQSCGKNVRGNYTYCPHCGGRNERKIWENNIN